MTRFVDRLIATQQHNDNSALAVMLAPSLSNLPFEFQRYDDPFLPLGKAVIDATRDVVCAYIFDLASYLALGAAGAIALERTIPYVPEPLLKILHGPFATGNYAAAAFENALNVDAVTLAANVDAAIIAPYLTSESHGVFIYPPDIIYPERLNMAAYPGQIGMFTAEKRIGTCNMLPDFKPGFEWFTATVPFPDQEFKTALHSIAVRVKNHDFHD